MNKFIFSVVLALYSTTTVYAKPEWGYDKTSGPDTWYKNYPACAGFNQSPVNIIKPIKAKLPPLNLHYQDSNTINVQNNGHALEATFNADNYLVIDGKKFQLVQFHLHSSSETTIANKQYAAEIHFVHRSENQDLLVTTVLLEIGQDNPALERLFSQTLTAKQSRMLDNFSIKQLLPKSLSSYRYSGSLTTPPCTEGVRWIVYKNPMTIGRTQLEKLHRIIGFNNGRPAQKLNARNILSD